MSATALAVQGLCVRFGGLVAVDQVSFAVAPGSITAIIGPNGAGKTTLFNAISGIHPPSQGVVLLDGQPLAATTTGRTQAGWATTGLITASAAATAAGLLPAWQAMTDPQRSGAMLGAALGGLMQTPATPWAAAAGLLVGSAGAALAWQRSRRSPEVAATAGVARTFQNLRLFRDLSARDNVRLGAHRHLRASACAAALRLGAHRRDEAQADAAAAEALELVGLTSVADRAAGHLPYGHQRRLEIARALASRPRLLLLDEPAAGMHAGEADALEELVRRIRDRGITILLIEHHMRLVMRLAERIVVLHHGAKLAEGTPTEIRANPQVVAAYLGHGGGHA